MRFAGQALLWMTLCCVCGFAQSGIPGDDEKAPRKSLDELLSSAKPAKFKWAMHIEEARLSAHQRLLLRVEVRLEAQDLLRRPESARALALIEFIDSEGRLYHNHGVLDLDQFRKVPDLDAILYTADTFIKPGDYYFSAAILDVGARQYSIKRQMVHVAPISHDPLPNAWDGLPAVEFFVGQIDPPEGWLLPEVTTRLHLPVETRKPMRVEVLVNESPSERNAPAPLTTRAPRLGRANSRNMSVLLPAMKILSQIEPRNGSLSVSMLDLARRKVSFDQSNPRQLDWAKLKTAVAGNDPNKIDIHELENREQNPQFFVSEVRRRVTQAQALIVLSGPMAFPDGADLRPIDAAPDPACPVFYIRYYPPFGPPNRIIAANGGGGGGHRGGGGGAVTGSLGQVNGKDVPDSLENTLKPLSPRLFNVLTPDEFRKALASILDELSKM